MSEAAAMWGWQPARFRKWDARKSPCFRPEPPAPELESRARALYDIGVLDRERFDDGPRLLCMAGRCVAMLEGAWTTDMVDGTRRAAPEIVAHWLEYESGAQQMDGLAGALFALMQQFDEDPSFFRNATADWVERQRHECLDRALVFASEVDRGGQSLFVPIGSALPERAAACMALRAAFRLRGDAALTRPLLRLDSAANEAWWMQRGYLVLRAMGGGRRQAPEWAVDLANDLHDRVDSSIAELGRSVVAASGAQTLDTLRSLVALEDAWRRVPRDTDGTLQVSARAIDQVCGGGGDEALRRVVLDRLRDVGGAVRGWRADDAGRLWSDGGGGERIRLELRAPTSDGLREATELVGGITQPLLVAAAAFLPTSALGTFVKSYSADECEPELLPLLLRCERHRFAKEWREIGDEDRRREIARCALAPLVTSSPAVAKSQPLDLLAEGACDALPELLGGRLAQALRSWPADLPLPKGHLNDTYHPAWWLEHLGWLVELPTPAGETLSWADLLADHATRSAKPLDEDRALALWGALPEASRAGCWKAVAGHVNDATWRLAAWRELLANPAGVRDIPLPALDDESLVEYLTSDLPSRGGWPLRLSSNLAHLWHYSSWRRKWRQAWSDDAVYLRMELAFQAPGAAALTRWPEPEARSAVLLDLWLYGPADLLRAVDVPHDIESLAAEAIERARPPRARGGKWEIWTQRVIDRIEANRWITRYHEEPRDMIKRSWRIEREQQVRALHIAWDRIANSETDARWASRISNEWLASSWREEVVTVLRSIPLHLRAEVVHTSGGEIPLAVALERRSHVV